MPEFVLVIPLLVLVGVFVLDAGLTLHRYSILTHTATSLTRHLSGALGNAWRNGKVAKAPWNGSCTAFLRDEGNAYLTSIGAANSSVSNRTSLYYYGLSLDDSTALIGDPNSPYAVLRIAGRVNLGSLTYLFFPRIALIDESSMLVEYRSEYCRDY